MVYEDERPDASVGNVAFKYEQPSVSVDTSARYASHKVIGDTTVRQKIGEEADEISVEGVCTESEANDVDALTDEESVEVVSNRWNGEAHVASTSTRPITDGGGKDIDGDFIYRYTIELVEVTDTDFEATGFSFFGF